MDVINVISLILTIMVIAMFGYQFFYILVSLIDEIKTRIQKNNQYKDILNGVAKAEDFIEKDGEPHRFGFVIAARNEENVIANLIESIRQQNYPSDMIDVFVVADNCTDKTADVAREAGAVVYERFNDEQVGKSYALNYLFNKINADYGSYRAYDGYFIFDADNIVGKDFTRAMNNEFCKGYRVVTGYRNSKNFGTNWITAGYSIAFMREAKYLNNSRKLLKSSTMVSGTGYLVSSEIIEENKGWHFNLMTEDIQLSAHLISNNEKIGYAKDAMFYDEQPTTFMQSWHQRMRWVKGYFQVYKKYGRQLLSKVGKKGGFSCFDMLMSNLPAFILTMIATFAGLTLTILALLTAQDFTSALLCVGKFTVNTSAAMLVLGIYTTLTEWKHIHMAWYRKIGYMFTFPIYMLTYIPIAFMAMFKKVEWKPIAHGSRVTKTPIRTIAS